MSSTPGVSLVEPSPRSPPPSKWEIRLPQLLNSTVGPDRQVESLPNTRRDFSRVI